MVTRMSMLVFFLWQCPGFGLRDLFDNLLFASTVDYICGPKRRRTQTTYEFLDFLAIGSHVAGSAIALAFFFVSFGGK